jgi:23S rRNA (uracil1939-C5)-methyltransferase
MGRLGEALAEVDGKQVFVFGGIPGETVQAEVLRERRGHIEAQAVEVIEPSPHRVAPPCPHFGECTGCQWQHIDYQRQLEMKREIVVDALFRVGGLQHIEVQPTLPSPQPLGYRNHARFTISREGGRLGYVNRSTRRWVGIDRCLLMEPWINETLAQLQGHVGETTQLSLRYGVNTGSWLLQPSFLTGEVPMESGQKHYQEKLLGHYFQVGSPSFFQVNTPQAAQIARLVEDSLELTGDETVVDAYAGVGTFAVLLAAKARRVIAIEESAAAIMDARVNIAATPNVNLVRGRTEEVLSDIAGDGVDAVVLDPSRTGCQPGALEALIAAKPRRIAYVSCDPETLARDLKILVAGPFRIERVQPVDMFAQTHHVECVVTLAFDADREALLAARHHLILASGSPRRREIISRLGLDFDVAPAELDEASFFFDDPVELVEALALNKAQAVAVGLASGTVIGADTVVSLDGAVLGKPGDAVEATAMLKALRGREHRVVTGVALVDAGTGESEVRHCSSRVVMRDYTDAEIEAYVLSGDPMDKAGAYAVQNEVFHPAAEVKGCFLNVMGLPLCTFLKMLYQFQAAPEISVHDAWGQADLCPECAQQLELMTRVGG